MCDPEPFSGDLNCWRRFLLQCRLFFFFFFGFELGAVIQLKCTSQLAQLEQFIQKFERIFGHPNHTSCALDLNDQVHNVLVSRTCPKDLNEPVDRVSSQSQS